ncbi:MAG: hypothetical protein KGZ25_05700 [Planctomycetes bacterium]|nr:hypothetical protein [Planctomycetota bacterium]
MGTPDEDLENSTSGESGHLLLVFKILTLVVLTLFLPVVLSFLYHGFLRGNPVLLALRENVYFLFFLIFLSAWVGGRLAWVTAPAVSLISGLLYTLVETIMTKPANVAEDVGVIVILTLVVALPTGLVVSYYLEQLRKAVEQEEAREK